MITVEPFSDWEARQVVEELNKPCDECHGWGECECCGRDCLACDGTGRAEYEPSERELEARYFTEVMDSLKRLCAFSTRHDFLNEAGDFIKAHGRLDLPPWERSPIRH